MISDIIYSIAPTHYDHFKYDQGFPGVCYISSQVIASLLKKEQSGDVKIVYGTFGPNQLLHCWVECEGLIVDLTQFQFLTYKQRPSYYKRMEGKELMAYAIQNQRTLVFDIHDETHSLYHPLAIMKEEFAHLLSDGMTYDAFLVEVFGSKEYEHANWAKSRNEENKSFAEIIEERGLRITRRFFTKWAIVPK